MILHLQHASDHPRQRLFKEIMIWRRLSHPNVLPVLGVYSKPVSLCLVTEWMINKNIMDFTLKNPEVNRLHLVSPVSLLPRCLSPDILA